MRGYCTSFYVKKYLFYANIENVYVYFNPPYLLKNQKR